jgi:hypothetical protein
MTITSPRKSSTYPQDASCLRPSCTMPQSSHPAEDDKGKVSADEKAVSNVATRSATNEVDPEEERRLVRKLDTRILPIACLMYLFACEYLHLICVYNVLTLFFLRPCSDLDRSNLGNARLQGLPDDILDGDPSGKKFDWVNSIFFFSYVRVQIRSSESSLLISSLFLAPDPVSSSSHCNVEALPSSIVDGYYGNLLGIGFDTYGLFLPRCLDLLSLKRSSQQSTSFNFGSISAARVFLGIFEAGFGPAIPIYFCTCSPYHPDSASRFVRA